MPPISTIFQYFLAPETALVFRLFDQIFRAQFLYQAKFSQSHRLTWPANQHSATLLVHYVDLKVSLDQFLKRNWPFLAKHTGKGRYLSLI